MAGKRFFMASAAFAATLVLVAAPLAAYAQSADDGDDDDQAAELAQDIGCVATYDVILANARGHKISALPSIQKARDLALNAFREDSDLPDEQVRAEITQAEQALPQMLQETHQSLADYKAVCDATFGADPFADSDKTVL